MLIVILQITLELFPGEEARVCLRALLEYDNPNKEEKKGEPAWRARLEQQQGAVFAAEAKNNANRLTRSAFRRSDLFRSIISNLF
jgi:hypothetical protein